MIKTMILFGVCCVVVSTTAMAARPTSSVDLFSEAREFCIGWACPELGEADVWFDSGEVRLVWGTSIERLVIGLVPDRSSVRGRVRFAPYRYGVVHYVGAWLLPLKIPSPLGTGGAAGFSEGAFWSHLDTKKLRIVESHSSGPAVCYLRTEWEAPGISYQLDLLAYRDMEAVVYAREIAVQSRILRTAVGALIAAAPITAIFVPPMNHNGVQEPAVRVETVRPVNRHHAAEAASDPGMLPEEEL